MRILLALLFCVSALGQTQQLINVGTSANDGSGDTLRGAAIKINTNFFYLYQQSFTNTSAFSRTLFTNTSAGLWRVGLGLDSASPGSTGTNILVSATPGAVRVILGLDEGAPGAFGTNVLTIATAAEARALLGLNPGVPGAMGTNLLTAVSASAARTLLDVVARDGGASTNQQALNPTLSFQIGLGSLQFSDSVGDADTILSNQLNAASTAWPVLFDYTGVVATNMAPRDQDVLNLATGKRAFVVLANGFATNLTQYVSGKGSGEDVTLTSPSWTNYWSWSYNNDGSYMWPKIIGYGGAEVSVTNIADYDILNWGTAYRKLPPVVASVSELQSFPDSAPLVLLTDTNVGGLFVASSTALTPDSGNVFTNTGMARVWVRVQSDHIINVMHFGAVGNGTTDDTAAIQLAVTAAAAQKTRGVATLYFPQGTYYCTNGFDARDMHVKMDGTILSSSNLVGSQLLIGQNTLAAGNPSLTYDLRLRMNGGAGFNADPDGIKTNVIAVESRYLAVSKVTLDIEGYPVGFKLVSEDNACTYNQIYCEKIRNSDICIWLASSASYGNYDSWWWLNRVIAGNSGHGANASANDGFYGQAILFLERPSGSAYSVYQHNFVGGLMEIVGRARGFIKTAGGAPGKVKIIGTHIESSLTGSVNPTLVHSYLDTGGPVNNGAITVELEDIDIFDEGMEYKNTPGSTVNTLQMLINTKRTANEYIRESSYFNGRAVNDIVQNESSTAVYSSLINFWNDSANRITPAMGSSSYRLQNWGNGSYAIETTASGPAFLANIGGVPGIRFNQEGTLPSVIRVKGGGNIRMAIWTWDGTGANLNPGTNYWPVFGGTMTSSTNGSGFFYSTHSMVAQSDLIVTPRVKSGVIGFYPRTTGETFFSLPDLEVVQGSLAFDWPGLNPANCNKPSVMTAPYTKRVWYPGQTWLSPEGQLWMVTNGGESYVTQTNSTTQIVVANATGMVNGDYIAVETDADLIVQNSNPTTVHTVQRRHFGQITGLSGTTVTFSPALTNLVANGRRVWTWAWTSKVEPSLLSTKNTTLRNSLDDSVERLSATAAAFNPTGWTISGTAVTTNGTTYAVTNSSGTVSLTHALSGSPLKARTWWTLTLTLAGNAVVYPSNPVYVQLGGTTIGQITNGMSSFTYAGRRTDAANQNVVITTTYVSDTITQFECDTATLTTYATTDVGHGHTIAASTYSPSSSAAPYFRFSAGGTHAANGNAKDKVIAIAGSDADDAPEVIATFATSDNGGDWYLEGKVYATGAASYALEAFYTDPTTTIRDSVPITNLSGGFFWGTGGYFTVGGNADTADADIVFRTSSIKGEQ